MARRTSLTEHNRQLAQEEIFEKETHYGYVNIQMGLELIKCKYLYVRALIETQLITCTTRRHVSLLQHVR